MHELSFRRSGTGHFWRRAVFGLLLALALPTSFLFADDPTVGWLGSEPGAFSGYTIFSPLGQTNTYLVDDFGREVNTWPSTHTIGVAVYLLDDGSILRTGRFPGSLTMTAGGVGGVIEIIDWDGNQTWQFDYSSPLVQHHHDVEMLPNGNVLILAWEYKSGAEAIQAGRDPATMADGELWPEQIVEVQMTGPTSGQIVWSWSMWDHLVQDFDPTKDNFGVVADHPELLDIHARGDDGADWLHANGIDYNPDLDQIVISMHRLSEIFIIDHSTTTAEASGHTGGNSGMGGDILYRWGNPENYGGGTAADRTLFRQHCPEWVPAGYPGEGNITIFNNGVGRPAGAYSTIEEIAPPMNPNGTYVTPTPGNAFGPTVTEWTYTAPDPFSFNSSFISGVRRLPNGNSIVCSGAAGLFFELDPNENIVWSYEVPTAGGNPVTQGTPGGGNNTFRAHRHAATHPGLVGQDLTPGDPIEIYPMLGDFDNDGDVDGDDLARFELLFTGPGTGPLDVLFENAEGFYGDFDLDGDIDCTDALAFEALWTDPSPFPGVSACTVGVQFVRGDVNLDGSLDISDAISILSYLFSGGPANCLSAADANDDSGVDVADGISLLGFLFGGPGNAIPAPNSCGVDPTPDALTCSASNCP